MPLGRLHERFFSIHQDSPRSTGIDTYLASKPARPSLDGLPGTRTLTPASAGTVHAMPSRAASVSKQAQALGRTATIRSVPSFEGSETSPESNHASGLSSSVASKASNLSTVVSVAPAETARPSPDNSASEPVEQSGNGASNGSSAHNAADPEPAVADPASSAAAVVVPLEDNGDEHTDGAQWDSTIGKAGLGKTGRVINKLVSDNEALKREIKIEKLRAEEAKQAAKLLEDKMERMINDYESRLLEANVTKTLLARKERQVETLLATVDTEKKKTVAAQELERNWRDEMDKVKRDAKTQVDDATSYAQLMEGRYNAISSHWRDQGDEVNKAISTIKTEINTIVDERKSDDDKIQTLRDLCEQQDSNIQKLRREKEDIARLFDEYKRTQEDNLRDIKENARKTEEEQQRILDESRETLHKLRWALKVKENVKGAE